jgi:ABC-type Fe3+-siderophore transport system permease subunit
VGRVAELGSFGNKMKLSPASDKLVWALAAFLGPFLFIGFWIVASSLYQAYAPPYSNNEMNMGLAGAFSILIITSALSLVGYVISSFVLFFQSTSPNSSISWIRRPFYNRFWIHALLAGLFYLLALVIPVVI